MNRSSSLLLGALCAALLLHADPVFAQSNAKPPTQMTYQGFLTDGNGLPFGNSAPVNKTVIFRIYDSLSGGTLKWSSQQVVTVDKGYFSVLLGQGSAVGSEPFNADMTGVFTGAGASDRYLELNADGTTIAPRLRFLPAPSAMLAKSATELLDPLTGASALSISGGNITVGGSISAGNLTTTGNFTANGSVTASGSITVSGNVTAANVSGSGANLTSLNASQITSGSLNNARTSATSSDVANTIVARDGAGGFSMEALSASGVGARSGVTSHSQGAYLEWNKDGGGGMSYLLNQKGGGGGGIVFGEVSTANDLTERMRIDLSGNVGVGTASPSSKLHVAGQVTADSFKINNTPTLVLFNISRFAFTMLNNTATPMTGVSQTVGSGAVYRQGSLPSEWWKSTVSWGLVFYSCTFTVPAGEVWEVDYTCNANWATDDYGGIVWTLNDDLTDDSPSTTLGRNGGLTSFGQSFTLTGSGTYTVRVKGGFYGGSGSDAIYFPVGNPAHCVVKKYKSN